MLCESSISIKTIQKIFGFRNLLVCVILLFNQGSCRDLNHLIRIPVREITNPAVAGHLVLLDGAETAGESVLL